MKRNKFSLSHTKLFTADMGELVPIACFEALPGDTIQQSTQMLLRCQPMLAPVYHNVHVRIHHWFVPNRLLWDNWEEFITGGPDGMNASVVPTVSTLCNEGDLSDYFGIPVGFNGARSALPYRAYALIWNEFYRDQDLQAELPISKADGADTTTNTVMQNVAWEKDYFTSARPWPQKGPAVTIPIAGSTGQAPVKSMSNPLAWTAFNSGTNTPATAGALSVKGGGVVGTSGADVAFAPGSPPATDLYADLSATAGVGVTVNALRAGLSIQRYEEARARYGSRYVEYLRYLGVRSSDARLQRPEYLGGGRNNIQFSEVLQTAPSTTPSGVVGDLKGHGISSIRSNRYRRFFEEHGIILSLMSVLPKTMYMQGLFRQWNRTSKADYWQKEYEHIGQQEIQKKEIWGATVDPNNIWGYQDRYDEYRRQENTVAGEFRSTLNFWHFGRIFASEPALNASFVKSVPSERSFATTISDVLMVYARHSIQARRMLSKVGTSHIF